jgi:hypothetical protein
MVLAMGSTLVAQTKPAAPEAPAATVDPEHNMPDPETAPPEVIASARAAVEALGAQVVIGKYEVAIERMYPTWKKRMAERVGGMDKLNAQLANVATQMQSNGMSLISFKPEGQPTVHEVSLGKKSVTVNGRPTQVDAFTKWMLIFPTATQFKLFKANDPKPYVVETTGFQVAISDKGKNEWTFIDGSGLKVADLRSLFSNLPEDLKLPPIGGREVKTGTER